MRTPALGFALLLVVVAVVPASAFAVDPGAGVSDALTDSAAYPQLDDGDDEGPRTTVRIALRPDRSAEWRVQTRYSLESQNETRAFRSLAAQYEDGEGDAGPDVRLFESLMQRASDATGRSMAIEDVAYHSSVSESGDRGTLALSFRWTNFLRAGGNETLVLDDVFRLPTAESDEQRTWLSIFDADQEIAIHPPDGYTVTGTSIPVQQRESAVVLAQPSDFEGDSELRITYTTVGPADQLPIGLLAGGGIVVLALLSGAWWFRRRGDGGWDSVPSSPEDPGGPAVDGPAAEARENGGEEFSGANGAAGSEATAPDAGTGTVDASGAGGSVSVTAGADGAAGSAGSGDEAPADQTAADVDLSLLSDEERVEHLLGRNGGRMKQATIVDETGWSDAKVSQLLSAMADEGRVEKLRLGRENLISLPEGADTDDAESADTAAGRSGLEGPSEGDAEAHRRGSDADGTD
ncbi:DUF7345 domain-containing protein [Halobellus sp. GM3]|uniref:DUF7345 domain-containing protein n=1 Tax=Halobellus sp. GM3 TaxID=3458410 RepID=UPI00403E168B